MANTQRRAVFTSLGVLTSIGTDPLSYYNALAQGTSGVRPISHLAPGTLPCQIAAPIENFDPKKVLPSNMKEARKSLNKMARTVQLGLCAAHQAFTNSGLTIGQLDPFRFGVEFACVMITTEPEDLCKGAQVSTTGTPPQLDQAKWGELGLKEVTPLWMLKYLPNMPACHVSINYNAQGPNNTITTTEVAGLLALGEAYRLLQRDAADYFLVGGCESKINPLSLTRMNQFFELNRTSQEPTEAIRPFDTHRAGTVLGEGAAVFGLEECQHAEQRNATILAELVGFASGYDRERQGSIFGKIIRNAMSQAGVTVDDIDHVNSGASGSVEQDRFEAAAIADVFGDRVPVFAVKGNIGYTGAAAGLVELTASVLAFQHGQLPGTLNCPNPISGIFVHTGSPRTISKPYCVKLSTTELGHCAAVVVKKWDQAR